ncbi:hypothetical protein [Catenovulum sediminis]|uniref:N-acetyltransferase domain-containing protein n=1 Tax=Catenovulum sediminis TaxID=1740262 RepID=A0ABV1RGA8_9ALTE
MNLREIDINPTDYAPLFELTFPLEYTTTPIETFEVQISPSETPVTIGLCGCNFLGVHGSRLLIPPRFAERILANNLFLPNLTNTCKLWGSNALIYISDDSQAALTNWQKKIQYFRTNVPDTAAIIKFVNNFTVPKQYTCMPVDAKNAYSLHLFLEENLGHSTIAQTTINTDFSFIIRDSQSQKIIACAMLDATKTQLLTKSIVIDKNYRKSKLIFTLFYQASKIILTHNFNENVFCYFEDNIDMASLAQRSKNSTYTTQYYYYKYL